MEKVYTSLILFYRYTISYTELSIIWLHTCKLIEGSSRLDQDITGTKKALITQGFLNPVISCPNMEGVKDMQVSIKTLQA